MQINYNVTGQERKALVTEISRFIGMTEIYKGAPTFAYVVNNLTIDRTGALIWDERTEQSTIQRLLAALAKRGYQPEQTGEILEDAEVRTPEAETAPESEGETIADSADITEVGTPSASQTAADTAPDRLAIEYPLEAFTPHSRLNLEKLVESKAVLIKEVLGVSELPIEETDQTLRFPWFPANCDNSATKAYTQFITALCDTAIKKSRVVAKAQDSFENPRFAMRVWLIGLGLVGKEFDYCRKLMMSGLSGNSGFRYGKPEDGVAPRSRDGIQRDVISIRLTPDALEKLGDLAAKAERETGQRLSRNMLIEQAVEAYIREAVGTLETLDTASGPETADAAFDSGMNSLGEILADAELIHNVNKLLAGDCEVTGNA